MHFSKETWISGEKSGGVHSDRLICDTSAKVILIFCPATSVTDSSALTINIESTAQDLDKFLKMHGLHFFKPLKILLTFMNTIFIL